MTGDGRGTSPNRKQKRKTRSSLTSNACTNCKQAKAKVRWLCLDAGVDQRGGKSEADLPNNHSVRRL